MTRLAVAFALASCSVAPPNTAAPVTTSPSGTAAAPTSPPATPAPSATNRPGPTPVPDAAIEIVATGLRTPLGLVASPDGSGRLFIVEQTGQIRILDEATGALLPEPFLDIADRLIALSADYDERGLLGLAFHPDVATNGRFFVYYSAPLRGGAAAGQDHTNTLSEFRMSPGNPDAADPASERFILRFEQPQPNHSGGGLGFGPDGYLYLGTGDGGGTGDDDPGHSEGGNAQDRQKLNGKVLRLDIDAGGSDAYAIPADNPFAGGRAGRPEVFAYGFRNPWRLSWEPDGSRRLLVSDVGYGRFEEVDVVENGGNYGWRVREGAHCLDPDAPLDDVPTCDLVDDRGTPLTDPVIEYQHRVGIAVVGGYAYRGAALPGLRDMYLFGDYTREFEATYDGRGSLFVAEPVAEAGISWQWRGLVLRDGPLERFVTGLGEGALGELYVLTRTEFGPVGETGEVLRLVPPG